MGCVSVLNKPNPIDIAPCVCLDGNGTDRLTLYLDCNNKNLDDTKLSLILNYFLAPGISPLGALILSQNQLTKIPDQIKQFDQLNYVDLDQKQDPIGRFRSNHFHQTTKFHFVRIQSVEHHFTWRLPRCNLIIHHFKKK